ncbi:MAG: serine/threonine protein kinase [Pyrinomonadaceae bacterium]
MSSEDVSTSRPQTAAREGNSGGSMIGRVLYERFRVERDLTDHLLGDSFAVYHIKDLNSDGREAVLKLSRVVLDDSGESGPSLKEVSNVLARLRHPNIEEIIETGHFPDGRAFALAKHYPAATLHRLVPPGTRLEMRGVIGLIEQIADALDAAHSRGILHCDVRPANILVPPGDIGANNVRLINFGSAWPIDVRGESLANLRRGSDSMYYAAPELLVTLGHRSPVSDVYSFSVLVYRLIMGSLPFEAPDRVSQLEAINSGRDARRTMARTDFSDEARRLLLSGLDFEPVQRPKNIGDLGRELVRLLGPAMKRSDASVPAIVPRREKPPPEILTPRVETKIEEPSAIVTHERSSARKVPISERALAWALIVLLVIGALSIPIGQSLLKEKSEAAELDTIAERPRPALVRRQIRYWFAAAGEKGGPTDPPTKPGSGLTFVSDTSGVAFVILEFAGQDGRAAYRLGFPTAGQDIASRSVQANEPVAAQTEPHANTPADAAWIIWTAGKNPDLEAIVQAVNDGIVSNEDDRLRLRHFLERNRDRGVEIRSDDSTGQVLLAGSGNVIVHRIGLGRTRS